MKNNITWYPHDADAHRHPKMKVLKAKFGYQGQAWFWIINGMIAEADNCILNYSNSRDKLAIMAELDFGSIEQLDSFISYLLSEECELLVRYEDGLTTDRVQEALSKISEKRESAKERIQKFRNKRKAETANNDEKTDDNALHEKSNALHLTDNITLDNTTLDKNLEANASPAQAPIPKEDFNKKKVSTTNDENKSKDLRAAYSEITKDKPTLYHFIKNNQPSFPDPYVQLWNIWAQERNKAKVAVITDKRKRHFNARMKEKSFDFIAILTKAKDSNFCIEGKWFTFDWLIKSTDNYIKVLEGSYDNESASGSVNSTDYRLKKLLEPVGNAADDRLDKLLKKNELNKYLEQRKKIEERTRELTNEQE